MGIKRIIVVLVVCLLGCGKSGEKEQSPECKKAGDAAYQIWGAYIKALDKRQPRIAKKAEKFAPEGYAELKKEAQVAIEEWQAATAVAKEQAAQARFGKGGTETATAGEVALEKAQIAHDKAEAAIERAFAARLQEGADAIQRRKDAANPEGKRLSAKRRVELEQKLVATQERVAENNKKVQKVKDGLTTRADEILDLVKKAVEADKATAAACAH